MGLAGDRRQPRRQETSTSPPRKATRVAIFKRSKKSGKLNSAQRQKRAASPSKAPAAAGPRSASTAPTRSRSAPTVATSTRPSRDSSSITAFRPQPEDRQRWFSCRAPKAASPSCPNRPRSAAAAGHCSAPDVVRRQPPTAKERLRRLLLRQRGRGLRPQPGHRRACAADRNHRLHRRIGERRLRHRDRSRRDRGAGDQPRRERRLRRRRPFQRASPCSPATP